MASFMMTPKSHFSLRIGKRIWRDQDENNPREKTAETDLWFVLQCNETIPGTPPVTHQAYPYDVVSRCCPIPPFFFVHLAINGDALS